MNRRPLCQAAMLTAIGIALYEKPFWIICAACLTAAAFAVLEVKLFQRKDEKSGKSKKKRWQRYLLSIVFVPLCFSGAMLRMSQSKWDSLPVKADETIVIRGTIYDRQDKEEKSVLYLKEIVFLTYQNNQEVQTQFSRLTNFNGKCIAYYEGEEVCSIGNTILIKGILSEFDKSTNPGQFCAESYYRGEGIRFAVFQTDIIEKNTKSSQWREVLYALKGLIHQKLDAMTGEHAGILQAMLLGEKSQIDSEIKQLYQKNGISHITVISGLHFSMIGMCIYQLLRRFGCSFAVGGSISFIILFFYGIMTGFGVSAVRAYIMFAISIGAEILGKEYDLPSSLGAAVLFLLYCNPYVLFQTGFLLSVSAILGIIVVLPILEFLFPVDESSKTFGKATNWVRRLVVTVIRGISAGVAIQITSFPVLLYSFYEFSPYSIFLNCLVIPLLSVVMLCAIAAVIVSFLIPSLAQFIIIPSVLILKLYESLCLLIGRLPGAYIVCGKPAKAGIVTYYCMIGLIVMAVLFYQLKTEEKDTADRKCEKNSRHICDKWMKLYKFAGILLFGAVTYLCFLFRSKAGIKVAMIDVGQGQSIYIRSGKSDILYDGGSTDVSEIGKYRIVPFLKASGVDELELVIVSHLDADHYNGIEQILEDGLIKIECLMLPFLEEPDESYLELIKLAKQKGVSIQMTEAGDNFKVEETQFRIFHPTAEYKAESKNDASLVMHMQYKDFTMLFTGDVEHAGEERMLQEEVLMDVDVLQVAHHGSNSSSMESFLQKVSPETALISCGRNNRYGHPSKQTIKRLKSLDCTCHVTAEEGCILFEYK